MVCLITIWIFKSALKNHTQAYKMLMWGGGGGAGWCGKHWLQIYPKEGRTPPSFYRVLGKKWDDRNSEIRGWPRNTTGLQVSTALHPMPGPGEVLKKRLQLHAAHVLPTQATPNYLNKPQSQGFSFLLPLWIPPWRVCLSVLRSAMPKDSKVIFIKQRKRNLLFKNP